MAMTRIRPPVLLALLPVALATIGVAALDPSLFSSDAPVPLQIKAPLNELFNNARQKDDYAVTGAVTYLDAFYNAIGSDAAFYRPVVTTPGTKAYTTAERTTVVCPDLGAAPPGTAVSDPIETTGTMIKVVLLDTQWNWATPNKCPEIHNGAVWIERAAISKDFPKATVATTRP